MINFKEMLAMPVNSYILPDYFIRKIGREMSYVYMCVSMVVLVGVSDIFSMDNMSLRRAAAKCIVENEGDKENILCQEAQVAVDAVRVVKLCKEKLPESFEAFGERVFLQRDKIEVYDDDKYEPGPITGLTFIGAFPVAVAFGENGVMQWWNTSSCELIDEVKLDKEYYRPVSSRDGFFIAAACGKEIVIWSTKTHENIATLSNKESVYCLAFSLSGKELVVGSRLGMVTVFDVTNKTEVKEYIHFREEKYFKIDAVRITEDKVFAIAKNCIKCWDRATSKETVIEVPLQYNRCLSSSFISDTKAVVCLSDDTINEVCLSDGSIKSITLNKVVEIDGVEYPGVIYDINKCCFSADGRLLILAEGESNSLWCLSDTKECQYDHIKDFYAKSWFLHLEIRHDNLVYLMAPMEGSLQLCTIDPTFNKIGLKNARQALSKKTKHK